jgi:hypothetical protein
VHVWNTEDQYSKIPLKEFNGKQIKVYKEYKRRTHTNKGGKYKNVMRTHLVSFPVIHCLEDGHSVRRAPLGQVTACLAPHHNLTGSVLLQTEGTLEGEVVNGFPRLLEVPRVVVVVEVELLDRSRSEGKVESVGHVLDRVAVVGFEMA